MQTPDRKSFLVSALLMLAVILVGALYLGDMVLSVNWCPQLKTSSVRIFSGVAAVAIYLGAGKWILSGVESR